MKTLDNLWIIVMSEGWATADEPYVRVVNGLLTEEKDIEEAERWRCAIDVMAALNEQQTATIHPGKYKIVRLSDHRLQIGITIGRKMRVKFTELMRLHIVRKTEYCETTTEMADELSYTIIQNNSVENVEIMWVNGYNNTVDLCMLDGSVVLGIPLGNFTIIY